MDTLWFFFGDVQFVKGNRCIPQCQEELNGSESVRCITLLEILGLLCIFIITTVLVCQVIPPLQLPSNNHNSSDKCSSYQFFYNGFFYYVPSPSRSLLFYFV